MPMKISFSDLTEALSRFHFEESGSELELPEKEATLSGPARVDITVLKSGTELIFEVSVNTSIQLECARCVKNFSLPVQANFRFILLLDDKRAGLDTGDEDYTFLSSQENSYDLAPRVRDAIILSVPLKPLCMADCKGLCPVCGLDLNYENCNCRREEVDPRWSRLKDLLII